MKRREPAPQWMILNKADREETERGDAHASALLRSAAGSASDFCRAPVPTCEPLFFIIDLQRCGDGTDFPLRRPTAAKAIRPEVQDLLRRTLGGRPLNSNAVGRRGHAIVSVSMFDLI
jgi:hypothetical protein